MKLEVLRDGWKEGEVLFNADRKTIHLQLSMVVARDPMKAGLGLISKDIFIHTFGIDSLFPRQPLATTHVCIPQTHKGP